MITPTFSPSDLPKVLVLIFIEWFLSSDNALVLATIAGRLKKELQKKALFIGLISAFILRGIAIFFVAYLIQFIWLQILGGLYLLYIAIRFFFPSAKKLPVSPSFWKTVLLIEFIDLLFAFDSIFAGVAFIKGNFGGNLYLQKLWIVYVGVFIGIIGVRFAAKYLTQALEIFPRLALAAHLMIGGIALHLIFNAFLLQGWLHFDKIVLDIIFWTWIVALFILGLSRKRKPDGEK